jgi:hypothetical protein
MIEKNGDNSHPIKEMEIEKAGQKKPQNHILGGQVLHGSSRNRQQPHRAMNKLELHENVAGIPVAGQQVITMPCGNSAVTMLQGITQSAQTPENEGEAFAQNDC